MADDRRICEDTREVIGLSLATDATVPAVAGAKAHLEQCEECRRYLKRLQEDDRDLASYVAEHDQRIRDLTTRAVNALPDRPVRSVPPRNGWRWIMATGTRRTAAAAAIAAALFLVVFLQGPDASFDAWAEVIETVRQATSSQFSLRDMKGSDVEARQVYSDRGTAHLTYEDGELVEALHVDFENSEMVYLAYPLKIGARMTMDRAMLDEFLERNPANTFDFLQEYEFEDLGRRRVDGRQAVGIRITDARFLAQRMDNAELELWVDPETRLPIRFDVKGDVAGGARDKHVRFYDFRWNETIPEESILPDIPADFDITGGVHLEVDEEHLIEGLRLFSDVVGRYPTTLAYESLKVELWRSAGSRRDIGRMVLKMFRIRLASDFFGQLVKDERGVVYFGQNVRPGDGDRVLLRWQADDGDYRVVFGNLDVETVDGARLLDLEGRR